MKYGKKTENHGKCCDCKGKGIGRKGYHMGNEKIYQMEFSKVYPLLVKKAVKKGRAQEEVDAVIFWLTGYGREDLEDILSKCVSYGDFFQNAPQLNENRKLIRARDLRLFPWPSS